MKKKTQHSNMTIYYCTITSYVVFILGFKEKNLSKIKVNARVLYSTISVNETHCLTVASKMIRYP